jgi:CDP-6-deoxy-D-xylo-4-hexulose-3-dehydrase
MINNIERLDLDSVIDYLKSSDPKLTHGPLVKKFEQEWSNWLGTEYSVMVNSGASANDLTMLMLKEQYGACEIIVPPITWVSDVASILHAGHKPIFVDINFENLALDFKKIESKITNKTKAIFLTHVLGLNGLSIGLLNLVNEYNLELIEDVCESHGAKYMDKKVGTLGSVSNFSFYYAHHMTTIEGGMISTNNHEIYQIIKMMRSHGMVRESDSAELKNNYTKKYPNLNPQFIFAYAAHNMRPTEINGILGSRQLKRLNKNIEFRTSNFRTYCQEIDRHKFIADFEVTGSSSYALPIILRNPDLSKRDKIERMFQINGIEFRRGLSGGGNQLRQPYLQKYIKNINLKDFPVAEHIHSFSWYVGNYPSLETNKVKFLCELLNKI